MKSIHDKISNNNIMFNDRIGINYTVYSNFCIRVYFNSMAMRQPLPILLNGDIIELGEIIFGNLKPKLVAFK